MVRGRLFLLLCEKSPSFLDGGARACYNVIVKILLTEVFPLKLNYKKTICVGFAFFLISMFWQVYDTLVPKILTDKFGMAQTWSGLIMALDNVFALFLLPLFGALSDKLHSKHGRRTPFIFIGTILAAVLLVTVAIPDGMQRAAISDISGTEGASYTESLGKIWDENPEIPLIDKEEEDLSFGEAIAGIFRGEETKPVQEQISREDFTSIPMEVPKLDKDGNPTKKMETNKEYTEIVVPARQAVAARITSDSPAPLIIFIVLLLFVLVAMGTFRSPAVALMPDVTIKPLRSKGNAIINLMGAAGGIIVLGLGILFGTGAVQNSMMSYTFFFSLIAVLMLGALVAFLCTVREPKLVREMEEESRRLGIVEDTADEAEGKGKKLDKPHLVSLLLILASVALWYIGYNAVTTKYSVYATNVLGLDFNTTMIIAQAAAIVSYIPAGIIASKVGRKKTILGGVILLFAAFLFASFLRAGSSMLLVNVLFIMAGIGWATINVNSFPMVVELSKAGDVGRYTGYYYTASMSAQIVTPILSGIFMDAIDMTVLFPYAAIFVAGSFMTMLFVRHGDAKPAAAGSVLEQLGGADD